MIEYTEYKEKDKVDNLYNAVKKIILLKNNNQSFDYNRKQHHLYEESKYPGINKDYYNEYGTVEFENTNGKIIRLEISRWHPHKHNGFSGLNGIPCLTAEISIINNKIKQVLWKLNVESGTLYYKAKVSSLKIPYDILHEKQLPSNYNIQENDIEEIVEDETEAKSEIIYPQETRILFDEIVNLYNKYKYAKEIKEKLLLKRETGLEVITEKIIKFYSAKTELNDFDKLFAKYSTFNIDLVGNAIQQLISIVESEEYLYKQFIHKSKKRVCGVMGSWDNDTQIKARIVVRKDKLMNCYDSSCKNESKANELVKNGDALLLFEQDINSHNNKKITFYTSQDGEVVCYVDFGRFGYIKEFIDSIVQFRFQNHMVEFTEKDMLSFMKNFIIRDKNIIVDNYNSKIKEKALSLTI